MSQRKTVNVPFELKSLSESGEFTGIASPYGVKDLGNDVVDQGAFTKTIAERGNKVRLLDGHDVRIGIASVKDSPAALEAKGQINLDKQAGRDAYSDLKFYRDQGLPLGLSIGFETLKAESLNGARHLKEVRLWEISITEFPMNEAAVVTSVKHAKEVGSMERKMDFNEALDNIQTWSARYSYIEALSQAICDAMFDDSMDTPAATEALKASFAQCQEKMIELLPKLRALYNGTYGYDFKRMAEIEKKAGRKISAESRTKIEAAISELQALLGEEAADSDEGAKSATQRETKSTSAPVAAAPPPEPVDHSAISSQINDLKGVLAWN